MIAFKKINGAVALVSIASVVAVVLLYFLAAGSGSGSKREVQIEYKFRVRSVPLESGKVQVWIPVPFSDDSQQLISTEVSGRLQYKYADESDYGNRYLLFTALGSDIAAGEPEVTVTYRVVRHEVFPLRKDTAEALQDGDIPRFLKPSRMIPITGVIQEEARRVAGDQGESMVRARLIYDHIVESVSYDKTGVGWGRGDALYACDIRKGNCTDFHSLLIGQMRALNIPARFIMGLPLPEDTVEGQIKGYHCWAEFYIDGKGWLPVDASEASKHPEKKDRFFACLDKNRVAFTLGRDIKLPGSHAPPLNYSIYPYAEVDSKEYDNVEYSFYFKDISGI